MTGPCFVDANVFVYARDARDARKQERSAQWIEVLWRERLGRTSAQAIAEFYAVATRKLGIAPERAWQHAARYFTWNPHPVDEALLRRAREIEQRFRLSWWDSMIVAAAQLQDCALLLTEDLQDGMIFGSVTVCSPFTASARQPAAPYAAVPAAVMRHRPRGRPPRAARFPTPTPAEFPPSPRARATAPGRRG